MTDPTWAAIGARRLERSLLASASDDAQPADVAAAMAGTHAQVMAAAEISIALRMTRGTRSHVQAALWEEHSLIKTYGLRNTVHLFAARDLPMWTAALATVPPLSDRYPDGVRLTGPESQRIVDTMADALEKAELTAEELEAVLVNRVGSWAAERSVDAFLSGWPRWRLALYRAVGQGVVCFGPNRGAKVTWTSVRRLIPDFEPIEPGTAIRSLLRVYLRAYGPSTPAWFARWVAAPKGWADTVFRSLREELVELDVEGTRLWVLADDQGIPSVTSTGVRLLPHYDAYAIAWQPRERMFAGVAATRALARGQAGPLPLLLVDGVVAGVWRRDQAGKRLAVTVEPFEPLRPSQKDELEAQVVRLGEILGARAELMFGGVSFGARTRRRDLRSPGTPARSMMSGLGEKHKRAR